MNDDLKRVNLRDIVDRISENTIVLPDFQRGFTWKEYAILYYTISTAQ